MRSVLSVYTGEVIYSLSRNFCSISKYIPGNRFARSHSPHFRPALPTKYQLSRRFYFCCRQTTMIRFVEMLSDTSHPCTDETCHGCIRNCKPRLVVDIDNLAEFSLESIFCPVCVKPYTEILPQMLECGHSLCRSCSATESPVAIPIRCPTCAQVSERRYDNRAFNSLLLEMGRLVKQAKVWHELDTGSPRTESR